MVAFNRKKQVGSGHLNCFSVPPPLCSSKNVHTSAAYFDPVSRSWTTIRQQKATKRLLKYATSMSS